MTVGAAVRDARKRAGLTLRSLSALVSADFTYLSKIENGHDIPSRFLASEIDLATRANGDVVRAWSETRCPTCGGPVR